MTSNNRNTAAKNIENRKHQRLPIEIAASVTVGSSVNYHGTTKNISFNGTYIQSDQATIPDVGTNCIVTLMLQDGADPTTIKFKARIKHIKNNNVGLEFQAIFAEDYNDFVYLMVNNSPDPDALLDEISRNPGIKIHT